MYVLFFILIIGDVMVWLIDYLDKKESERLINTDSTVRLLNWVKYIEDTQGRTVDTIELQKIMEGVKKYEI